MLVKTEGVYKSISLVWNGAWCGDLDGWIVPTGGCGEWGDDVIEEGADLIIKNAARRFELMRGSAESATTTGSVGQRSRWW